MKTEKFSVVFPEEKEILKEENFDLFSVKNIISKALRKEILMLYKLGLEDYEIRYLLAIKQKEGNLR